jgi:hypothetical protein
LEIFIEAVRFSLRGEMVIPSHLWRSACAARVEIDSAQGSTVGGQGLTMLLGPTRWKYL